MGKKLSEIYLIDETKLTLYSDIARNVGVNKLLPYVAMAQELYIEGILGKALTAELTLQIANGNLTPDNKTLLLKIAMPLALYTQFIGMRGLAYSIVEKGILKLKSEESETLNEKELAQYIYSTRDNADLALELLIKYLCNCKDLYPNWRPDDDCNCDKYLPKNDKDGSAEMKFNSHIYFSKKVKNCDKCIR